MLQQTAQLRKAILTMHLVGVGGLSWRCGAEARAIAKEPTLPRRMAQAVFCLDALGGQREKNQSYDYEATVKTYASIQCIKDFFSLTGLCRENTR